MTEQKNIMFNLVKNHFSLDDKSIDTFRDNLNNPFIPEVFKDKIDEEHRIRLPLPMDERKVFDEGWIQFCDDFYDFKLKYNITYNDFLNNKVVYNKNTYKLITLLKKEYQQLASQNFNIKTLNKCLENRIPKEAGEIVISFNFIDWFLCSTGESWSSCISLESSNDGCYWAGLPGLIVDKNRCLIFISLGKKKEYFGLVAEKMVARTWALLSNDDTLDLVKFYPVSVRMNKLIKYLKDKLGIEVREIMDNFKSKYTFDLLRVKTGDSCFIYLDNAKLKVRDNKFGIVGGTPDGYSYFDINNNYKNADLFSFCDGFSTLVKQKKSLNDYLISETRCYCEACGNDFDEEDMLVVENYMYCEDCYNEIFCSCSDCGKIIPWDDSILTHNESNICEECFVDSYFTCDKCGDIHSNDDLVKHKNLSLCPECSKTLQKKKVKV